MTAKTTIRLSAAIALLLFVWYLVADRFTPYTSNVRVKAIVIDVVPEVSGYVSALAVSNAQLVDRGDVLAQIDPRPFALELERAEKRIGSSLQAAPEVFLDETHRDALAGVDLADIAITSDVTVTVGAPPASAFVLADSPEIGVVPKTAAGEKCARCWKVLPEVGTDAEVAGVCGRCADAVRTYRAAAE